MGRFVNTIESRSIVDTTKAADVKPIPFVTLSVIVSKSSGQQGTGLPVTTAEGHLQHSRAITQHCDVNAWGDSFRPTLKSQYQDFVWLQNTDIVIVQ